MAGRRSYDLKSLTFRREREAAWKELEDLVERVSKGGLGAVGARELHRLPTLYRAALSSLSVARAISLDKNLLAYLESLTARAYLAVYGAKRDYGETVLDFFRRGFPARVWAIRFEVLLALFLLVLGTASGTALTLADPDLFYSLVSEDMAGGRGPASSREELEAVLYQEGEGLDVFASFLFSHNAQIGMSSFGLGFAAGVPVALLLFYNGLVLGAFVAVHVRQGLGLEFWAWVLPHGVTELLAVALCGGAGFAVGRALVFPGRYARLTQLVREGRKAAGVVLGAVALFFVAALIEGFFRQMVTADAVRLSLAVASFALWVWYFAVHGRRVA